MTMIGNSINPLVGTRVLAVVEGEDMVTKISYEELFVRVWGKGGSQKFMLMIWPLIAE